MMRAFRSKLAAGLLVAGLAIPATATAATTGTVPAASDHGTEVGAWEIPSGGGPALTNATAVANLEAAGVKIVRVGIGTCLTGSTCGRGGSVTGSLDPAAVQATVQHIAAIGAIPWVKFPPMSKTITIGSTQVDGTQFCPPADGSNWGLNLAMDKAVLAAIHQVYTGPLIYEISNEAQYNCYAAWGFASAGATGVSKNIADMWSATGPALQQYATGLGFTSATDVAQYGVDGGTSWGSTCAKGTGTLFGGWTCTFNSKWISEFLAEAKANYTANGSLPRFFPRYVSGHSYCQSPDFSYSVPDNECYAYARAEIKAFHADINTVFGTTLGNTASLSISEWNVGSCTSAGCAADFGAGTAGSYVTGFMNALQGNGQVTGATGTRYRWGVLFCAACNSLASGPPASYDLLDPSTGQPAGNGEYAAFKAAP